MGRNAKLLRNGQKVGIVRLEETDERGKQPWFTRPGAKLVRPDSGQVEETVGPATIPERCRKSGKGQCVNILRGIIWRIGQQSLTTAVS